jgi:hypothetical protein
MKPHMSEREILTLEKYLLKCKIYFEFGCGGSTVFASSFSNIEKIYSVESDESWIERVKQISNHKQTTIYYIDINAGEWGHPKDHSKVNNWTKYSSVFDNLKDCPDVVLVDGRFRVASTIKMYNKLNEGTLLIHDYGRKPYRVVEELYDLVEQTDTLACFRKKKNMEGIISEMYEKYKFDVG